MAESKAPSAEAVADHGAVPELDTSRISEYQMSMSFVAAIDSRESLKTQAAVMKKADAATGLLAFGKCIDTDWVLLNAMKATYPEDNERSLGVPETAASSHGIGTGIVCV